MTVQGPATTTTLARSFTLPAQTLGEAWLSVARLILEKGRPSRYDDLPMVEVAQVTLDIATPDPDDPLIGRYADPDRLDWMRRNFVDRSLVAALGNARSYASRVFDYAGAGRNQLDWVVQRLRDDPTSRSATITTFEPLADTSYIPCVSMLDFWLPEGALELVVYAHSIDFGAKGYGNLVQLAELQHAVSAALGSPVGRLTMVIKSAHVYETEREYMQGVLAAVATSARRVAGGDTTVLPLPA